MTILDGLEEVEHPMTQMSPETWTDLCAECKARLATPIKSTYFVFYFVLVVVGLGSIGVWWPMLPVGRNIADGNQQFPELWALCSNLATYFVALVAATFADAHLREDDGSRQFRFIVSIGLVIVFLFGVVSLAATSLKFAGWTAGVGAVLSLLAWWIVNATNASLRVDPPSDAPTGGSPEQDLAGSLSNIEA